MMKEKEVGEGGDAGRRKRIEMEKVERSSKQTGIKVKS